MKFGNFEFKLKRVAADPMSPAKVKKGLEVGDTGTRILAGVIGEEYNSKLRDRAGIDVYDEMRKSDGTVKSAILVISMPIRSAKWYIEPGSEDAADVEIADFVTKALFEYQSIAWDDLLRQALLSMPFGVMVFEKVFATADIDGKTRVIWDKIAPRMPRSIYKWAIGSSNDKGITQNRSDGTTCEIPISKLLIFVNEMEGENWWGTSILRAPYKHWFIKNTIYKIDAIAHERQGLGVPYAKIPEGYTETDRSRAEDILKNLRANKEAFIIEPHDYEIGFKDMMGKSTRDPESSITHHNREIMKSVLAQFLELGASSGSGSRAVSQDHSELFLQSLETVANGIANVFNKYAIKQLVDFNYDNVKFYPKLAYTNISKVDAVTLSTAYQTLISAGGMKAGSTDEQWFREHMGLPERDPEGL